jgi:hypothetical protein
MNWALRVPRKPSVDEARSTRIYGEVLCYAGVCEVNP